MSELALYVSTDLDCWETENPHVYASDVGIYGTCYRLLDPEYFAWLKRKMALAKDAASTGKIPSAAYEEASRRFAVVSAWAAERLPAEDIERAHKQLQPRAYVPPSMEAIEREIGRRPAAPPAPPSS